MVKEVVSPVTRRGSKVGSSQPLSPGARSAPGERHDSIPPQPIHRTSTHQEPQPVPASTPVTVGPED
jgi:hypothetical protein